jgi:uncharacterized repeat protein (TIGR03943 family)
MKTIFGVLIRHYRVFLFFIWAYALIDLLGNKRYQTFLRPEFGIVLGVALAIFLAFMIAEMARKASHGLKWHELPRPIILLIPLMFLMNAQGASLDYYTFKKRFTGTQGMSVNIEPSDSSTAGAGTDQNSGPAGVDGSKNGKEIEDVPSSLSPSASDRRVFSRKHNAADGQVDDSDGDDIKVPVGGVHDLTIIEVYKAPKLYEGKTVSMVGMVDRNDDVRRKYGEKTMILYRFMIACCAADAQPVALMVETKSAVNFQAENVWVKVQGRFTLIKDNGKTVPYLRDATISTVTRPEKEYLY